MFDGPMRKLVRDFDFGELLSDLCYQFFFGDRALGAKFVFAFGAVVVDVVEESRVFHGGDIGTTLWASGVVE